MIDLLPHIEVGQSPGGTFLSTVHLPSGEVEDTNCFITALVLRELSQLRYASSWQQTAELEDASRRALGYLMRSVYPVSPHAYSFYPHQYHPFWMDTTLFADADDTAVIALELVRYGKRDPEIFTYIAENYLRIYRASGTHLYAPWQREGVYLTWFTTADIDNPIDCCVNTNVVAMLAVAGLQDTPGYKEACAMINDAAAWAGADHERLRQLTPYYPHPIEWYYALDHAVKSGAEALRPARDVLASASWLDQSIDTQHPVCSSLDGDIVWTSDVLHHVRQFKLELLTC